MDRAEASLALSSRGIPAYLQRYFWEYDPDRLELDQDRHTIIRRLLESGGWDATCWLRAEFGDAEIRDFLIERRGRGLTSKRLRFWQLVLQLPAVQVDDWIRAQRSNPWWRRNRA